MTIECDRGTAFDLSASFTVPDLPGDDYDLAVCIDPCTISGFREPLTGAISIVQTAREAELVNERRTLSVRSTDSSGRSRSSGTAAQISKAVSARRGCKRAS